MADPEPRPLDPAVVTLWRQYLTLALGAAVAVALVAVLAGAATGTALLIVPVAVVVLVLMGVAVARLPDLRYRTWRWALGDAALEITHGVVFRERTVVPYFRVQNVDITSGPLERRLGLVRLQLRTAASGTDGEIPGLAEADAVEARRWILERAGTTTGL